MAIDTGRLQEFLGRFIADLGATVAAGSVEIGHRLCLYSRNVPTFGAHAQVVMRLDAEDAVKQLPLLLSPANKALDLGKIVRSPR